MPTTFLVIAICSWSDQSKNPYVCMGIYENTDKKYDAKVKFS